MAGCGSAPSGLTRIAHVMAYLINIAIPVSSIDAYCPDCSPLHFFGIADTFRACCTRGRASFLPFTS